MKQGIHPENYRLVAFKDMSNDDVFITKSTVESKDSCITKGGLGGRVPEATASQGRAGNDGGHPIGKAPARQDRHRQRARHSRQALS